MYLQAESQMVFRVGKEFCVAEVHADVGDETDVVMLAIVSDQHVGWRRERLSPEATASRAPYVYDIRPVGHPRIAFEFP